MNKVAFNFNFFLIIKLSLLRPKKIGLCYITDIMIKPNKKLNLSKIAVGATKYLTVYSKVFGAIDDKKCSIKC